MERESYSFRPGNFAETIILVIITVSFLQNVNDNNDNFFLQNFYLNIIVSEPFQGRKGMTQKHLYTKMTNVFLEYHSQALIVCLVLHLLLLFGALFTRIQLSYHSHSHLALKGMNKAISFSFS